jgi:hypothetical protein
MTDRPPGRDTRGLEVASSPGRPNAAPPPPQQQGSTAASLSPGADSGRDLDAALSVIHSSVDSLGPWLAIWEARREPDAFARRCASDAIDAIDAALAALHSIRGELVGQVRRADDEVAARADVLLARTREGGDPVTPMTEALP